jgi:hypothetical protein
MRPELKNLLIGAALMGLAINLLLSMAACAKAAGPRVQPSAREREERGRYLVTVLGCNDCHTPLKMTERGPEPDLSRMLSGHPESIRVAQAPKLDGPWVWAGTATNTAFAGPWGITYAANLTPDHNTGLGIWTEEMFVRTIRDGKHMGQGRAIMPPMPWPWYGKMTDEDLRSVYAFLRSLPPIENQVPAWRG